MNSERTRGVSAYTVSRNSLAAAGAGGLLPSEAHGSENPNRLIIGAVNIADALGMGRSDTARGRIYRYAKNPNFPRLYPTGGPIVVRWSDLTSWFDGMARNHSYSGKPRPHGSSGKQS